MRVLIVEDAAVLRDSLAQGLREAGYAVDAVADGHRGLIHAQTTEYDVIVLDWMLPGLDGLTALARMREKGVDAAVIMLTAKDALEDKVLGLTRGADDYLVKPFAFKELLARVQALGRRRHGRRTPVIRVGPLSIDSAARTAAVRDRPIPLAPREYALLEYLAMRLGKPVSRQELEEHLYDDRSQVMSNAIDATVYSVRSALQAAGCPPMIHTRRKVGYVLREPEQADVGMKGAGGSGARVT
ncbi:MAG: response regulator transcription factor [Phycisphaerae bacterium]|jgi:DNA-binding response OmpR family regulator